MRLVISLFSALLTLISSVSQAEEQRQLSKEYYSVGIILPLSGPVASMGQYLKHGIDLAFENLAASKQQKLKLIYEDDQMKPASSISAYQRLRAQYGVKAVFVLGSSVGNALAPLTEKDKVLLIAIGASDPHVTLGKKYSFIHWVTPETEANKMVTYIKQKDYSKIGIIGAEQEGFKAIYKQIVSEIEKQGLKQRVLLDQHFTQDVTDFRTYIARAKNEQLDLIILGLFPASLSSFVKQARALGLKSDFAGIELFEDDSVVKASDGALIGQWYINAADYSDNFIELYKAKYNSYPGWGTGNAYDSLLILSKALETVGSDNKKIVEYCANLANFEGALGSYSASGDHRFKLPAAVKVVTTKGYAMVDSAS